MGDVSEKHVGGMRSTPNKIEQSLSLAQLQAMLEELKALAAKPTLAQIQAVAKRYGVEVSLMGAKTFRDNTFEAHLARLARGREKTQTVLKAIGGGAHPLDAIEDTAAADILDAYTEGEEVDVEKVVKAALSLRTSLSMRQDSKRKDAEQERKHRETEKRLEVADQQLALRNEQIAKLQREKADWEKRREEAKAALDKAEKKGGLTADTRAMIEQALKGELAA